VVTGFALPADDATLAVGGPDAGIWIADTSDHVFRQKNTFGPLCLAWLGRKLFACGKEAVDSFSIGVSDDDGMHFAPVLHLPDITPRACASATSASICGNTWASVANSDPVPLLARAR